MENQEFDILLNKFIEGTISSEEFSKLETQKGFNSYQKILEASSEFSTPHIDEDESFNNFMKKTAGKEIKPTPVRKLNRTYILSGIAASLLLFFGLFQFLNTNETYTTGFGEQLAVVLPDGSKVQLNSDSSLKFNKGSWDNNRKVELEGEAYFKVQKGSQFKVETVEGTVSVLGTQFNVNQHKNFLEVQCFEGKVKVERNDNEVILVRGEAVRQIKDQTLEKWNFINTAPTWKMFESSFTNTPLRYVVENLIKTYGVTVVTDNIDLNKRFSGSYPTRNITVALETITTSMNLTYNLNNKKVVLRPQQ
ncbi:FecR family protein [Tenacibaculum agarivorans]|uniref:FecR family protein n=1 Tax=Tenacibaculum agarivorans TaxID=1908389 RepID=UPI00094BA0EC|nr:FecR domain-containing protein [Tenacibaculum agarivorans]